MNLRVISSIHRAVRTAIVVSSVLFILFFAYLNFKPRPINEAKQQMEQKLSLLDLELVKKLTKSKSTGLRLIEANSDNSEEDTTDNTSSTLERAMNDEFKEQVKGKAGVSRSEIVARSESQDPVFIVVLARMRTGSTLLGEILNQNPTLFYLYEPLIALDNSLRNGTLKVSEHSDASSSLYRQFSRCIFPRVFLDKVNKWRAGSHRSFKLHALCKSVGNCSKVTQEMLHESCGRTHNRIGVKSIRADLDYFRPLVQEGVNVKIIHLVRDPRGTANSRKMYYSFNDFTLPDRNETTHRRYRGKLDALGLLSYDYADHVIHTIPRLCQWTYDTIIQAQQRPQWLLNRYKLVRYEDFALEPLRTTRDIYKFVGIDLPGSVEEWILANTQTNDSSSVKMFSTHKNSSQTATRWRLMMKPAQVKQVEKICDKAMTLLGYQKLPNVEQLKDESISLLKPLTLKDTV